MIGGCHHRLAAKGIHGIKNSFVVGGHHYLVQHFGNLLAYSFNNQFSSEHGQWFARGGVQMTAIYHPAALLRDEGKRPETFEDLKSIQSKVRELCEHTDI